MGNSDDRCGKMTRQWRLGNASQPGARGRPALDASSAVAARAAARKLAVVSGASGSVATVKIRERTATRDDTPSGHRP